jgi:hypothetical protein
MRSTKAIIAIAFLLMSNAIVVAQEKKPGTISGYVKDARTKSPLIEAVVTLSSDAFTGRKIALTDSTGIYLVKDLPAGVYTVSFEMEGYRKFTQENILLKPGMSLGVSFQMARDNRKKTKEPAKAEVTSD